MAFDTIPSCVVRVDARDITSNSVSVSINGGEAPYELKYAKELVEKGEAY